MKTDKKRQEKFVSRLESIGVLHQDAVELAALTLKWVEKSGEEWTVKRFKALKLEFITGTLVNDCVVRRAPWVSRRPDGSLSGPLRRLWVDPHYVKHPQITLNALQIYSSFVASQATESQTSKFLKSARAESVDMPIELLAYIGKSPLGGKIKVNLGSTPYWTAYRSPVKRVPGLVGTSPETDLSVDLEFSANSEAVESMYTQNFEAMSLCLSEDLLSAWKRDGARHPFVGTVSYIQEAGYKLRAVANPTRVVQHALSPLKDCLGEILRAFPEDCTHDQESGIRWCQSQLQTGKTLSSIDLSDATNLFPFGFQEEVLFRIEELIENQETKVWFRQLCSIFKMAAKSPWRLPDGTSLTFRRGQPLGLGPSFFLFALSHHLILRSLAGRGKYVILGDDVVISDPKLAEKYRKLMVRIGCSISEEKSIVSQHLAEFASRLIQPTRVLRQWKWREITRSNVIDICRNMGPAFRSQVKKPLLNVIDAIAPIPIEFGGLGWNPKGIPMSSRIDTSVANHLIHSLKEDLIILRRWRQCAVSDFLTAYTSFRGTHPDARMLHPFLDKDYVTTMKITLSLMEEEQESWASLILRSQLRELLHLDRPGPMYGETVLWPRGVKIPPGYIPWGPPPNPWRTDTTSGIYQVVARLLRGERCAVLT